MIVKVQRALYNPGTVLIHDEGQPSGEFIEAGGEQIPEWIHEIYAEIELDADAVQGLLGDGAKGYFEAEVVGEEIVIGDRVDDQCW